MKNKFQSTCHQCGNKVEPGEGETNKVGDKWITTHIGTCRNLDTVYRARPRESIQQAVRDAKNYGAAMFNGYGDDEERAEMWHGFTSEDVNENEGSK